MYRLMSKRFLEHLTTQAGLNRDVAEHIGGTESTIRVPEGPVWPAQATCFLCGKEGTRRQFALRNAISPMLSAGWSSE